MSVEVPEHAFFQDEALLAVAEGASQAVRLLLGEQVLAAMADRIMGSLRNGRRPAGRVVNAG